MTCILRRRESTNLIGRGEAIGRYLDGLARRTESQTRERWKVLGACSGRDSIHRNKRRRVQEQTQSAMKTRVYNCQSQPQHHSKQQHTSSTPNPSNTFLCTLTRSKPILALQVRYIVVSYIHSPWLNYYSHLSSPRASPRAQLLHLAVLA